jgi:peroxiredoxin
MSTLASALDEHARQMADAAPPEVLEIFAGTVKTAQEMTQRAITAGDRAPDFTLADATGNAVGLGDVLRSGPVVLSFYRGGWCPFCNLELRALQAALPELTEAGATLIAVSPQTPDESLSTKEKAELDFHVLSDANSEVSRDYGLVYTLDDAAQELFEQFGNDLRQVNGSDRWELPVPATYVILPDRTVSWAFVDADYRKRAEPSEVIAAVQAVSVR